MTAQSPVRVTDEGEVAQISLVGAWTIAEAGALDRALERIRVVRARRATLELDGIQALDTAGAWLIRRTANRLAGVGVDVRLTGGSERVKALLAAIERDQPDAPEKPTRPGGLAELFEHVGFVTVFLAMDARTFLGFLGLSLETGLRVTLSPRRFRFTSFVHHLEAVGVNALPIVGLMSFLIGVVLAYQGIAQLRLFGAEIFTVDLVAISVLREIGVLMTAIVVAGRSGSAFTAQIGTMKLREEIDAMRALGLDPIEVLVLPRAAALIVALPLLVFFADIMGLLGGGVLIVFDLDLSTSTLVERLGASVTTKTFWIGMVKAPVFAAMIALIGCYQGFRVRTDAGSVGRLTTRSVVQSIFLVIVADALFSILFNLLGI